MYRLEKAMPEATHLTSVPLKATIDVEIATGQHDASAQHSAAPIIMLCPETYSKILVARAAGHTATAAGRFKAVIFR